MALRPPRCLSVAISLYNNTLQNCFPGNCRTILFISSVNRVARTSEEFKPDRSTNSSIGTGSSALNSSYSFFSEAFSPFTARRFRCSASGCSAWTSAARTGVGSSVFWRWMCSQREFAKDRTALQHFLIELSPSPGPHNAEAR